LKKNEALTAIILWGSILSFAVTVPHAIEDFLYGVPRQFGVSNGPAALILGAGYAVQAAGIVGVNRGKRWGLLVTLAVATAWLAGDLLDHLPDLLSSAPYREGASSRLLEILIVVLAAAIGGSCVMAVGKRKS